MEVNSIAQHTWWEVQDAEDAGCLQTFVFPLPANLLPILCALNPPSPLGYLETTFDSEHQIVMEKMVQNQRIVHGMSRDARPRKKARMSQEGLTGERTSVVELLAIREGTLYLSEILVSTVDGEWHRVPNELWAWTPSRITYRRCRRCSFRDDCRHALKWTKEYEYTTWTRKLLRTAEVEQIGFSPQALAPLLIPTLPRGVRDVATTAGQLPSELFKRIYEWDDNKLARTCRAVCQYWEKQCRRAAFRSMGLKSNRKIIDLVHRFKHDPAWQHIPPLVEEIWLPDYTARTKAPWMHLLDPRWKRNKLLIEGPFRGHQTLRSVHFCLPRSLPRSFSRGFTHVHLYDVRFGRLEDTICLASELPDLEMLDLDLVRWDSLPTEVPRRRPRANRNKLREVMFIHCSVKGVERPSFAFVGWTLFLGVSRPSEPLDSLDATHALVRALDHRISGPVRVERDCEGRVSGLDFDWPFRLLLQHRFDSLTGKDLFFAFLNYTDIISDLPPWPQLKSAIALLPHSWHLHFLFGLESRKDMLHCAADVVIPLSRPSEVRYAILQRQKRKDDWRYWDYWYEATLDSEELKGKGVRDPVDVYADWQKILKPPECVQSTTQSNAT